MFPLKKNVVYNRKHNTLNECNFDLTLFTLFSLLYLGANTNKCLKRCTYSKVSSSESEPLTSGLQRTNTFTNHKRTQTQRKLNPNIDRLSELEAEHEEVLLFFLESTFFRTLFSRNILSRTCLIVECFLSNGFGYMVESCVHHGLCFDIVGECSRHQWGNFTSLEVKFKDTSLS